MVKVYRDINGQTVGKTEEEWDAIDEANKLIPTYADLRKKEYPMLGDQLDVIWKQFNQLRLSGTPLIQEADDMLGDILAIKKEYPKPEVSDEETTEPETTEQI